MHVTFICKVVEHDNIKILKIIQTKRIPSMVILCSA